jgi:hypothetical protein
MTYKNRPVTVGELKSAEIWVPHLPSALVPFDVIRSCIMVLDVTAMEGHDLS